jgi:outer membrane protein assembly factor BamB
MSKGWIKRIGIFILVIMITCVVARSIVGISFRSKDFPLSEKWATKLRGDIQQITIVDKSVLIARTISEIYALDERSGNILWQQSTDWHFSYQPVSAKNGMLFLTDGKGVLALNQSDGKILWQQPLRHPSGAEVVDVNPGLVAVNDPPYLAVYQTVDGSLLWEKTVCRERVQAYFFDTNIVVPCYGLIVIDTFTGETIWETDLDDGAGRIWKSVFTDGEIYFSQDLEDITAYDVKNRKQLWKTPLPNDRSQAFKVIGNYLLKTKDDQLCVLHRDDGEILWCTDGLIKAKNPVIFGDVLYLFNGLQNGITAYTVHDGSQIGRLAFQAYNFITAESDKQLMVSSNELLIFASGNKLFAYGK